jgi:hypothetical protein
MKIPHGEKADLGTKVEDYVLNPVHREGRHKARVFDSTLGINLASAQVLRDALLREAATSEDAEARGDNGYGEVYVLRFQLKTERGDATITSAWIVRHGEDFPRLTTCFVE